MKDVAGRTAFITGGASGIGLGMAQVFLRNGMNVVVADVREDHLQEAKSRLGGAPHTHFLRLDVTDRAAMSAAANEVKRRFGNLHVLCNNAGVGSLGDLRRYTYADWDWTMGVNLGGVINGIQTFLPGMLAHGEEGHIVNTSSMGALLPMPGGAAYIAAKSAVMGLTEALRADVANDPIGVTLLIPGPTQTKIHEVGRLRPAAYQDSGLHDIEAELAHRKPPAIWMDPIAVGELVMQAILRNRLFVITHNDFQAGVESRFEAILTGFPRGPVDQERVRQLGFPVANPIYESVLAAEAE
jgi:NAD(P)-dependent dehydrogenase (short-subunit alcohol dehydrogenase family)